MMRLFQLIELACVALHVMAHVTFGGPFSEVFAERSVVIEQEGDASPPTALPMLSIELADNVAVGSESSQPYDVTLHTTTGCQPCERMKASLTGDARLRVATSLNVIPKGVPASGFPFITFRDDEGTLRYNLTARTADEVVKAIEGTRVTKQSRRLTSTELKTFAHAYRGETVGVSGQTIYQHLLDANHRFTADQLAGLSHSEMMAVHSGHHYKLISPTETVDVPAARRSRPNAAGGTIHGRERIAAAIDFIRSRVGEGVPMRFEWDRTGAQTLPLLRGKPWTTDAIYGKSGEFRLSAAGVTGLPISEASLGYRFVGGKLRLRGETEIDASLIDLSNAAREPQQVGSKPVGIEPMTVLSILSVLNGIWQALHPTVDLTLGGNVACEAVLNGDVLSVKFTQAPSVKIVAWFTFSLSVENVDISPDSVRIVFGGSRWIKERTFKVE